ncbi:MAG: ATP-binding protein [Planctomycetes bacterium]|nr:ATP-binding protein [Planctomycetota bacterium]
MSATIRRALRTFPAVVVTAPRQSGKTTLLREEFGNRFAYASLEDPDLKAQALSDPRGFLRAHTPPAILDEIQNAPELLSYVKTAIDEDREPGRWIITGSQNFPLMAKVTESLAGRAAILQLHGLSASEIPEGMRLETPRELLRGSFPEPRLRDDEDLRLWMGGYLQTYLERDVRQLTQVGDLVSFESFLRLCAARTAQLLRIEELARDAGISATTARRWLSVLEASGLFLRLPSYARSRTKRMVKAPKLYAADTGVAAYLTGHRDPETLWHGPMKGALFETAVLGEILKRFHNAGDLPAASFWRSSDGLEVDIVIEAAGRLHGIEVKANATPLPSMAEPLLAWRRLLGAEAGSTILVCDCDARRALSPEVDAVPWRETGAACERILSPGDSPRPPA